MILSEYCRENEDFECAENIANHRTLTKTNFTTNPETIVFIYKYIFLFSIHINSLTCEFNARGL